MWGASYRKDQGSLEWKQVPVTRLVDNFSIMKNTEKNHSFMTSRDQIGNFGRKKTPETCVLYFYTSEFEGNKAKV